MAGENVNAVSTGDGILSSELKNALYAYKRRRNEASCHCVLEALENVCSSLCFGDEEFMRRLNAGSYATVLVLALASAAPHDRSKIQPLAMQALSLLADLVPRGASAIASAKGIPLLLGLVKEVKPTGNEVLLESLLKCICHLSLEVHDLMVHENAIMTITLLETRVETHHLRMLCLKCLCHFFASAHSNEWNIYLSKPCGLLVARFSRQVNALLGDRQKPVQLSKENQAYLLRFIDCIGIVFERLLPSGKIGFKNSTILDGMLALLVTILERMLFMSLQGTSFRDAACSLLLSLFLTDPSVAVKAFVKHRVLESICGALIKVLDEKNRRFPGNSKALAEALLGNDVNAIPCIAEEQEVIPLLEFLLVVIPPASVASESDFYVTLPHHIWQWEDDFHNETDCSDTLSKQFEEEHEWQRRSQNFIPYNVMCGSRLIKVDFMSMQYTSNEQHSYYHSLHRHSILSGYFHRRPMCCNCGEKTKTYPSVFSSASQHRPSLSRVSPDVRCPQQSTPASVRRTSERRAVRTSMFAAENEVLHISNAGGIEGVSSTHRDASDNLYMRETRPAVPTLPTEHSDNAGRLVSGKGRSLFCCVGLTQLKTKRKKNEKGMKGLGKRKKENSDITCEVFRDCRDDLLRSTFTRVQFLNESVIKALVSWCLPTLITVVQRTVNPVIARHCSILILRCVDLVAEFFRGIHRNHANSSLQRLREKLVFLFPKLGSVLAYLILTNESFRPSTALVCPFKEFQTNRSFMQLLTRLGLNSFSQIPAPSLALETQMCASSTFLILHCLSLPKVNVFTDSQKLVVLQKIESLIGSIGHNQSLLRSSRYGSTGLLICPFHLTAENMEVVHEKLMEQMGVLLLHGDREMPSPGFSLSTSIGSYSKSSEIGFPMKNILNPFSVLLKTNSIICSDNSILSDIVARMGTHSHFPIGVRQVIAIHEYMLERGDDLSSFVCENRKSLEELAISLRDPVIESTLNADIREAFTHLRDSLSRLINEHIGLVNIEEICVVERQPPRLARRLRRSKATLAMTDRMWTPLRLSLEVPILKESALRNASDSSFACSAFSPSNVSVTETLSIGGRTYTILDVRIVNNVLGIAPMIPLSYLAKYILHDLNKQYMNTLWCKPKSSERQRSAGMESMFFSADYSLDGVFLHNSETINGDHRSSTSYKSDSNTLSHSSDISNIIHSATNSELSEPQEEESEIGQILSTVSATVPGACRSRGLSDTFFSYENLLPVMKDKTPHTVTFDNIVFFCNGEPVTDLSMSVLELCCKSSSILLNESAMMMTDEKSKENEEVGSINTAENDILHTMQRVLKLWSVVHVIQYAVVKEPLFRNLDDTEVMEVVDCSLCNPKRVFARLSSSRGIQCSLRAAASVLNEVGRILRVDGSGICHDERRICSALVHSFYNHLGALTMPPLTLPILRAFTGDQKDQHLSSYILWNYPQVFSFDIRRTLLQLLLSVRRVPTPALSKVREAFQRLGITLPLHGFDWIKPTVNIRGTKRVMVPRKNILRGGAKVLRCNAPCPLSLSVEFENEKGFGVGPALEFYSLLSNELQNQRLQMWRTEEFTDASGNPSRRVQIPLFPSAHQTLESLSHFEILGLLVGRVLMEERVVELPLHSFFLRGILGIFDKNELHEIDPQLDRQLHNLLTLNEKELEESDLMFVLYQDDGGNSSSVMELCPKGKLTPVRIDNVKEYCRAVQQFYCRTALEKPLMYFMQGLCYAVIPYHLQLFDPDELQLLIAGPEGKIWEGPEDFQRDITTAHGYDNSSPVISFLLDVVGSWNAPLQRAFLRFVTGSSRIPVGGLNPSITVVRRAMGVMEENGGGDRHFTRDSDDEDAVMQLLVDSSLPTVNTCVHYLKLPSYSSKKVLSVKLHTAVTEGMESFFLT